MDSDGAQSRNDSAAGRLASGSTSPRESAAGCFLGADLGRSWPISAGPASSPRDPESRLQASPSHPRGRLGRACRLQLNWVRGPSGGGLQARRAACHPRLRRGCAAGKRGAPTAPARHTLSPTWGAARPAADCIPTATTSRPAGRQGRPGAQPAAGRDRRRATRRPARRDRRRVAFTPNPARRTSPVRQL